MLKVSISNLLCFFLLLLTISCGQEPGFFEEKQAEKQEKALRIISLSGFLTELLVSTGYGDQIVGRDMTSVYPDSIKNLPNLGHVNQLNTEALLGLQPDMVLVEEAALTKSTALQQLKSGGMKIISVPTSPTLNNTTNAIAHLEPILNIPGTTTTHIHKSLKADSLNLADFLAGYNTRPSVLFLYARGAGRLMIAGTGTSADAMIHLAGAKNAVTAFDGFKALNTEALLQAKPDIILMFTSGLASLDGKDGLTQIPGMSETPAFRHDRIIAMDGHYLLSFGPRSAKAALELAKKIHRPD